jgi:protein CpxP
MTMMPSTRSAVLALAVLVTAPALALAQSAAPPAAAPAADAAAQSRVEARIKQLHAQLRVTPTQDAQWGQFADVMRENAKDMDAAATQRAEQLPSMNAVQDMKSYEDLAEAHVQRLQKLLPAFETLYNAMSPEQKQIADRVFRGTAEHHAQTSTSHSQ